MQVRGQAVYKRPILASQILQKELVIFLIHPGMTPRDHEAVERDVRSQLTPDNLLPDIQVKRISNSRTVNDCQERHGDAMK
jgi:hypothetical protein